MRHRCSACETGSQPVHGVVNHSWGHQTRVNLCTGCSDSLRLYMDASNKRCEQVCIVCIAGRHCRHCCSACKTGSQSGHVVVENMAGATIKTLIFAQGVLTVSGFTYMLQVKDLKDLTRSALMYGTAALPAKPGYNRVTVLYNIAWAIIKT